LDELQRVAGEVGIQPEMVAKAVGELANPIAEPTIELTASTIQLDREFEGVFDDEAWEDAVSELRMLARRAGTTKQRGSTSEWMCRTDSMLVTFAATRRGERTRLRLMADLTNTIQGAWVVATTLGVLAIVAGVKLSRGGANPWLALAIGAAIVIAGAIGTQLVLRASVKQALRRWQSLFEKAGRSVAQPIAPATSIQPATASDELVQRLGDHA
ncbi:MAG TPA: hypothetical protein VKT78_08175, partial [Fimbriimonadaceae bacterium]|nr:hypothetical protein [Fimbriimonadaceae bacterium]